MGLKVTEQERRRVKATAKVFGIIFIICAVLTSVFAIITPRATEIEVLGENNEVLKSLVGSHDGNTYFLQSNNLLCEFDSFTNEQLSEFKLTEEVKLKLAESGAQTVKGSLSEWKHVTALSGKTNDYFCAIDNVGNIFKLKKDAEGKLMVADDFYLVTGVSKTIRGFDNIDDRVFALVIQASSLGSYFYIEEYDLENLTTVKKTKFLWDIANEKKQVGEGEDQIEYQKIEAVKAATGVLAFYAHNDSLYFVKDGGGIIRVSTDLQDSNYGGGDIDFFKDAANASNSVSPEILQKKEEAYKGHLVESLAHWCVEYVIKFGMEFKVNGTLITADQITDKEGNPVTKSDIRDKKKRAEVDEKTQDLFKSYSKEELIAILDGLTLDNSTKTNIKTEAENIANELEKELSVGSLDWLLDYDPTLMSMFVKSECFDENCYASYIPGECTIYGMVLSKKNNALYYTNASDNHLYTLSIDELKTREMGDSIYKKDENGNPIGKIDNIHCGKRQSFDAFGNPLGYNKLANTLYLKFAYERKVVIVDINDMSDYKVIGSFTGSFNMYSLIGDKDNKVTQIFRKVTKVDMQGNDNIYFYYSAYEPDKFANKGVITTMFVVFLALTVISFFMGLWIWRNSKTDKGVKKIVFIAKDTKRNKFVYLALSFFIILLIMFCYYEAFGAIAMSFFNYTKTEPAWIWNNFANYIKIFNDSDFWPSVVNMLIFLVSDIIIAIVPPIIFAIMLILIRNKVASSWIRSLMFIPGIIPSIAGMLIWRVGIYGNEGLLNQLFNTNIQWLVEPTIAKWSLIFMGFPFIGGYLIFYGGMMNIPHEYHEAGTLEGLGTIKRFLKIDIPLIMPQMKYIFITTFIASVQNFARTQVLAASVTTPVQSMYNAMTSQKGDYGMSSAYATLIFLFLFAAIATNFKMQKQEAMGADL